MRVTKRNGRKEEVSFDKVTRRLRSLCVRFPGCEDIDPILVAQKVCSQIYDGVKTSELDELSAQICTSMMTVNIQYGTLASRIIISNNHKNTSPSFSETIYILRNAKDKLGKPITMISEKLYSITMENKDKLNDAIDYSRDFDFDFFGFKTLERAYLLRHNGKIIERVQHLFMRVALGIHGKDIRAALETYNYMSQKYFIHATPTLFHAGSPRPGLLSCFLLGIGDSVEGIYKCLGDCAQISKYAGGIGIHITNIRAANSIIRSTNGKTSGIVPMLKVFNDTARYINQSGKRLGSFAIYMEPWHADIEEFLELKKNHGDENARARDLFYAVYIPDLFMKKVNANEDWHLFCPDECPELVKHYGEEFEMWYERYVGMDLSRKVIPARQLWKQIMHSQIETGTPYIMYKDSVNRKSNQKNLGIIRSSNLCVAPETLILTDEGYETIKDLAGKEVNVWNGIEFSNVSVHKTGENQELITVVFSDGTDLTCTKYHKFYIQEKYISGIKKDIINHKNVKLVEAQDLIKGMKIIKCDYPVIDNRKVLDCAYTNGFFSGDGTYGNKNKKIKPRKCAYQSLEGKAFCKRHIGFKNQHGSNKMCSAYSYEKIPIVKLYDQKNELIDYLDYRYSSKDKKGNTTLSLPLDLEEKYFVPINYSLRSKLVWFSGYCDADGCIVKNGPNQQLQIASIHFKFLQNIKYLLNTCGCNPKITKMKDSGISSLPNGKSGYSDYPTKALWRLLLNSTELQKITGLGFSPKRLKIVKHTPNRESKHFITVVSVDDNNRIDDTYCFNEPKRHAGIFNGIITSQCTEIVEYSDDKEYACCTLASIGLPKYVRFDKLPQPKKQVTIVSKPGCIYCVQAKNLMERHSIPYRTIEIKTSEKRAEFLTSENKKQKRGELHSGDGHVYPLLSTFPQIYFDDVHIGGYTELSALYRPYFDYALMTKVAKIVTRNLDKVVDINYYPVPETKLSNTRHRPLGIGVQGLADVYSLFRFPFDSVEAADLNKKIFAVLYYASMEASIELAEEKGPYSTFKGSPLSEGLFQFDLWKSKPISVINDGLTLDWGHLRERVIKHGARNSLLLAPMPTASTSQILGNNECIEPYTSNIYVRRTLSGDFVVLNKHLLRDLQECGLWTKELKDVIILHKGSIQKIKGIPTNLKQVYKTSWDLSQKALVDQSADRGVYICQSQSLNLFLERPTVKSLSSMHFYSWKKGLKTGIYYLRTRPKAVAQQFTITPEIAKKYGLDIDGDKEIVVSSAGDGVEEAACEACSA